MSSNVMISGLRLQTEIESLNVSVSMVSLQVEWVEATVTSRLKKYVDGEWVAYPLKKYIDGEWTEKSLKYHDGVDWTI